MVELPFSVSRVGVGLFIIHMLFCLIFGGDFLVLCCGRDPLFPQTSCATTIIWYSHKLQTNKFVFMRYNLKLETTWISSPLLRSGLKYKSFSLSLQNVCLSSNLVRLHLKIFMVTIKLVYSTRSEYGTKVIDKAGNVSWHWHCMKAWWFIDKSSEE